MSSLELLPPPPPPPLAKGVPTLKLKAEEDNGSRKSNREKKTKKVFDL
jgi:hypothetical protein